MTFFHTLDEVAPPGAISGQQYPWVVLIAMTLSTAFVMIVTGLIAQAMTKRKKAVAASPQSSGEGESGLSPAETPCLNALSASEEKACDEKNAVSGAKEDGDAEISQ